MVTDSTGLLKRWIWVNLCKYFVCGFILKVSRYAEICLNFPLFLDNLSFSVLHKHTAFAWQFFFSLKVYVNSCWIREWGMDTHQRLDHCTILSTEAGNFGQAPNPAILFHAEVNNYRRHAISRNTFVWFWLSS